MKKIILFTLCCMMIGGLIGCTTVEAPVDETTTETTTTEVTTTVPEPEPVTVFDYLPMLENAKYVYDGEGSEYADYIVYIDYMSDTKVQRRTESAGTTLASVLEYGENSVTMTYALEEAYWRENLMDRPPNRDEVILQGPIELGTEWWVDDSRVATITDLKASVSTPSGVYEALEVTIESEHATTRNYYAKGIGLVKSVFTANETEITSTLAEFSTDAVFSLVVAFHYPDLEKDTYYVENQTIDFRTNDDTAQLIQEAYKYTPDDYGRVLTENAKINKLTMAEDGLVHLDMNRAFVQEMNAGARYEQMILHSLVNTVGGFYMAHEVLLTVEGEPYESGHIMLEEGELIEVIPRMD